MGKISEGPRSSMDRAAGSYPANCAGSSPVAATTLVIVTEFANLTTLARWGHTDFGYEPAALSGGNLSGLLRKPLIFIASLNWLEVQ